MQRLVGSVRNYEWGSLEFIPNLLGKPADNKPQAEYWLGAHLSSPSKIEIAGTSYDLAEWLKTNPQALGKQVRARFGSELPFLVKVLSARVPLSLQAHPNARDAASGFAKENEQGISLDDPKRTFKDPHHKPELIIALTPFDALVGFRDPSETLDLFDRLGVKASLEPVIGPLRHRSGQAGLAEVFLDVLTVNDERIALANEIVSAAVGHVHDKGELGEFARTAVLLDEYFPNDPSLIAALLLNRRHLEPGEGLHVREGTMHAYLNGSGIEVMASSDNVLRGGLTNKHIDVDALVQVVNFRSEIAPILHPTPLSEGVCEYRIDEDAFRVWRISPSKHLGVLPASDTARIVLVAEGEMSMFCKDENLKLERGQSAFLPAGEEIGFTGTGQALSLIHI